VAAATSDDLAETDPESRMLKLILFWMCSSGGSPRFATRRHFSEESAQNSLKHTSSSADKNK